MYTLCYKLRKYLIFAYNQSKSSLQHIGKFKLHLSYKALITCVYIGDTKNNLGAT